jgi:hypothetical protein
MYPFQQTLPPINLLARCPVLISRDGVFAQITGYDRQTGIMAEGGGLPDVKLDDARRLFCGLLGDYRFATPGDRSRCITFATIRAKLHGKTKTE